MPNIVFLLQNKAPMN